MPLIERVRNISMTMAIEASTFARMTALRLGRLARGRRADDDRPVSLADLAAKNDITLISTNGVCLIAPSDENFVRGLPAMDEAGRKELCDRFDLPKLPAKRGSHTHVKFFDDLYRALEGQFPNWEILDVGGYVGVFGLPLGRWAKTLPADRTVRVTVLEPSFLAGYIRHSIEINELGGIVDVRHAAASFKAGSAPFASPRNDRVASRVGRAGLRERLTIVDTVRLDDLVAQKSLPETTLIVAKIDTEGHEPKVLAGFSATIARYPTILALEFHAACLGSMVGQMTYETFLFSNFHIYSVGNIGYPERLEAIADGDTEGLRGSAMRGTVALTDLLCVTKRLPRSVVDTAFAGYLAG